MNKVRTIATFMIAALGLAGINTASQAHEEENFVHSIVKAPIVADGDVAFRQSDFVVNFAPFSDPTGDGIALQAGDEIRIELPHGIIFDNMEEFPICGIAPSGCQSPGGADRICLPGTLQCTTAVFLQGYPQSAIPPNVSLVGHTLVLTARGDTGPVVKQAHFIGKGTSSPHAGTYHVHVMHKRGPEVLAEGEGRLKIRRRDHPSINTVSVFASTVGGGPPFANTGLQAVSSGPTKYPWNFLIWDRFAQPFMDLSMRRVNHQLFHIRQGHHTVGLARVSGPHGAHRFSLDMVDNGTINTPLIGVGPGGVPPPLTQRYTVQFDAGSDPAPGCYKITIRLFHGNRETLYVGVPDTDACAAD